MQHNPNSAISMQQAAAMNYFDGGIFGVKVSSSSPDCTEFIIDGEEFERRDKAEERQRDMNGFRVLRPMRSSSYFNSVEEELAQFMVVPTANETPVVGLTGPSVQSNNEQERVQSPLESCAAITISTYPKRSDKMGRDGDPIADRYGIFLYSNRAIVVVADGCSWGDRPAKAAERARDAILNYMGRKRDRIRTVDDASKYLIKGFNFAHLAILEHSHNEMAGNTTLLAMVAVELTADLKGNTPWALVCASVGDCKAFHLNPTKGIVTDITEGNRTFNMQANDPGGRLGPTSEEGHPDLRNLRTYVCKCQVGDIILCMSDGVHDNLHPEFLGIQPRELMLSYDSWEEANAANFALSELTCSQFRSLMVRDIVNGCTGYQKTLQQMRELIPKMRAKVPGTKFKDEELTTMFPAPSIQWKPRDVVYSILAHVLQTTYASREWMETNPGKRLPKDYSLYPGKMDHTTMTCFRIGDPLTADGRSPSAATSPISPVPASMPPTPPDSSSQDQKLNITRRVSDLGNTAKLRTSVHQTPIAVTATVHKSGITVYCRTVTKSKFHCVVSKKEIELSVTPTHPFAIPSDSEVYGGLDDLRCSTYKRVITIDPQVISLDISTKRISYDSEIGIITISVDGVVALDKLKK